jgi:hypothetical protein
MMYLGPAFLAFALPAAARDAFADNPQSVNNDMLSKLALAAAGIPKIILAQTPVSGVNGLMEAMQGKLDKTVSAQLGFQTGQFIPGAGLLQWMTKITDPVYRRPSTIAETIQAGIPGLSDDIKAYVDDTGADATRPWTDVYLPYAIGTVDLRRERRYQSRMRSLKARIKSIGSQRERARAAAKSSKK